MSFGACHARHLMVLSCSSYECRKNLFGNDMAVEQNAIGYAEGILFNAKAFAHAASQRTRKLFASIVFARIALKAIRFCAARKIPQKQCGYLILYNVRLTENLFSNDMAPAMRKLPCFRKGVFHRLKASVFAQRA